MTPEEARMVEPVDLDTPPERMPPWANPAAVLQPVTMPTAGPYRRCTDCDVRWHGEAECWSCSATVREGY